MPALSSEEKNKFQIEYDKTHISPTVVFIFLAINRMVAGYSALFFFPEYKSAVDKS